MSSTNNFFKSTNKTKYSNIYAFDYFKSNNYPDSTKAKSSCSPSRFIGLKENNKISKNGSIFPKMSSYTNHPYKLMDVVNNFIKI